MNVNLKQSIKVRITAKLRTKSREFFDISSKVKEELQTKSYWQFVITRLNNQDIQLELDYSFNKESFNFKEMKSVIKSLKTKLQEAKIFREKLSKKEYANAITVQFKTEGNFENRTLNKIKVKMKNLINDIDNQHLRRSKFKSFMLGVLEFMFEAIFEIIGGILSGL